MTATRKNSVRGYDHVYQITADRGICFYSVADCLVWFSLMCVLAGRYNIRILAVCIMLNHYHIELHAPSSVALSSFMRDLNAFFTRAYNKRYGLSGPLFCERFKNAGKHKEQKIRDNYLYICNNPVVKGAVSKAEQYRWNFLAYMQNDYPFSQTAQANQDEQLEQVKAIIRMRHSVRHPLDYGFFDGLYNFLPESGKRQIADYIITLYNVIDYAAVRRMWGSFENLCQILQTVHGAEHDLEDDNTQENYRHYYRMIRLFADLGYDLTKGRFNRLSLEEEREIALACMKKVGATRVEIAKFLHCPYVEQLGI